MRKCKFGRTAKGVQSYLCKMCKHTYAETKGTVFHGCHHSQETILECLAMLPDRNSLAAIHPIKGVKTRAKCTGMRWTPQGLEALLALRTSVLNQSYDSFCQQQPRLIA